MNFYGDEPEWQWLFKNAVDWKTILPLFYPEYPNEDELESPEEVISFMEELLESTGEWAGESVAGRASRLDKQGPGKIENGRTFPGEALSEFYKEAEELSIYGISLPREFGGMELPAVMQLMLMEQVGRGCLASSTQMAFFSSIAEMIDKFCTKEMKEKYIPMIIEGKISGSMCLTEPGAGSDLGSIATTATAQEDGTYLLNGTKTFITNAGGGLGFVLARIKGEPEGLKGISMFFVEQDIEGADGETVKNFDVTKNEEKMGLHGSFTCEVVYENSKSYLVGEKNQGFKYMLYLMNEARLAVGIQALGALEASLQKARKYAEERVQFGKPIAELPLLKRNLEDYETERDAIRALIIDSASHYAIYQRLEHTRDHAGELTKDEHKIWKEASMWVRKRTPLVKYYACEASTSLSARAIQILGGYGFMEEYEIERIHRDSFAPLLYEGTAQVQALMALKDVVKYAMSDPKRFFMNILGKHPLSKLMDGSSKVESDYSSTHYRFKKKMIKLIMKTLNPGLGKMSNAKNWADEEKINDLMIHAETLCQALSYMETLRILADHANKDKERSKLFNDYHRLILPRMEAIYKDWSIR